MPWLGSAFGGHMHSGSNSASGGAPNLAYNGHARPASVLVVEDEVLIRLPVSEYLRERGYRVLEASTAQEAQAVLDAGEPIEVVFSDINMPGALNGIALAQWTRARYPGVKVILTSGALTPGAVAQDVGELPFLTKPYPYDVLLTEIERALGA